MSALKLNLILYIAPTVCTSFLFINSLINEQTSTNLKGQCDVYKAV